MNDVVYFDAAASFLKPESVIKKQVDFLRNGYANSGRGVCARAVAVDDMLKNIRKIVADFINARTDQIVFTSNATDGLNRIASIIIGQPNCKKNMIVAVSDLDHHSARLPWQNLLLAGKIGQIVQCKLDDKFNIQTNSVPYSDVLVITAMSNVLGVAQNVAEIIDVARAQNPDVIVIVDATQYVVHNKLDVCYLGADFVVMSGHKIGADTGVGVLYIRDSAKYWPDKMGGGMISRVLDNGQLILNEAPDRWEAGTLPLTQICGLGVAIHELEKSRPNLELIKYMYDGLCQNKKIKILTERDSALLSFVIDGMHVLDFGSLIGACGVCLRVGNMCASWIHRAMGIDGSIRVSVGPWNTKAETDKFLSIVNDIVV